MRAQSSGRWTEDDGLGSERGRVSGDGIRGPKLREGHREAKMPQLLISQVREAGTMGELLAVTEHAPPDWFDRSALLFIFRRIYGFVQEGDAFRRSHPAEAMRLASRSPAERLQALTGDGRVSHGRAELAQENRYSDICRYLCRMVESNAGAPGALHPRDLLQLLRWVLPSAHNTHISALNAISRALDAQTLSQLTIRQLAAVVDAASRCAAPLLALVDRAAAELLTRPVDSARRSEWLATEEQMRLLGALHPAPAGGGSLPQPPSSPRALLALAMVVRMGAEPGVQLAGVERGLVVDAAVATAESPLHATQQAVSSTHDDPNVDELLREPAPSSLSETLVASERSVQERVSMWWRHALEPPPEEATSWEDVRQMAILLQASSMALQKGQWYLDQPEAAQAGFRLVRHVERSLHSVLGGAGAGSSPTDSATMAGAVAVSLGAWRHALLDHMGDSSRMMELLDATDSALRMTLQVCKDHAPFLPPATLVALPSIVRAAAVDHEPLLRATVEQLRRQLVAPSVSRDAVETHQWHKSLGASMAALWDLGYGMDAHLDAWVDSVRQSKAMHWWAERSLQRQEDPGEELARVLSRHVASFPFRERWTVARSLLEGMEQAGSPIASAALWGRVSEALLPSLPMLDSDATLLFVMDRMVSGLQGWTALARAALREQGIAVEADVEPYAWPEPALTFWSSAVDVLCSSRQSVVVALRAAAGEVGDDRAMDLSPEASFFALDTIRANLKVEKDAALGLPRVAHLDDTTLASAVTPIMGGPTVRPAAMACIARELDLRWRSAARGEASAAWPRVWIAEAVNALQRGMRRTDWSPAALTEAESTTRAVQVVDDAVACALETARTAIGGDGKATEGAVQSMESWASWWRLARGCRARSWVAPVEKGVAEAMSRLDPDSLASTLAQSIGNTLFRIARSGPYIRMDALHCLAPVLARTAHEWHMSRALDTDVQDAMVEALALSRSVRRWMSHPAVEQELPTTALSSLEAAADIVVLRAAEASVGRVTRMPPADILRMAEMMPFLPSALARQRNRAKSASKEEQLAALWRLSGGSLEDTLAAADAWTGVAWSALRECLATLPPEGVLVAFHTWRQQWESQVAVQVNMNGVDFPAPDPTSDAPLDGPIHWIRPADQWFWEETVNQMTKNDDVERLDWPELARLCHAFAIPPVTLSDAHASRLHAQESEPGATPAAGPSARVALAATHAIKARVGTAEAAVQPSAAWLAVGDALSALYLSLDHAFPEEMGEWDPRATREGGSDEESDGWVRLSPSEGALGQEEGREYEEATKDDAGSDWAPMEASGHERFRGDETFATTGDESLRQATPDPDAVDTLLRGWMAAEGELPEPLSSLVEEDEFGRLALPEEVADAFLEAARRASQDPSLGQLGSAVREALGVTEDGVDDRSRDEDEEQGGLRMPSHLLWPLELRPLVAEALDRVAAAYVWRLQHDYASQTGEPVPTDRELADTLSLDSLPVRWLMHAVEQSIGLRREMDSVGQPPVGWDATPLPPPQLESWIAAALERRLLQETNSPSEREDMPVASRSYSASLGASILPAGIDTQPEVLLQYITGLAGDPLHGMHDPPTTEELVRIAVTALEESIGQDGKEERGGSARSDPGMEQGMSFRHDSRFSAARPLRVASLLRECVVSVSARQFAAAQVSLAMMEDDPENHTVREALVASAAHQGDAVIQTWSRWAGEAVGAMPDADPDTLGAIAQAFRPWGRRQFQAAVQRHVEDTLGMDLSGEVDSNVSNDAQETKQFALRRIADQYAELLRRPGLGLMMHVADEASRRAAVLRGSDAGAVDDRVLRDPLGRSVVPALLDAFADAVTAGLGDASSPPVVSEEDVWSELQAGDEEVTEEDLLTSLSAHVLDRSSLLLPILKQHTEDGGVAVSGLARVVGALPQLQLAAVEVGDGVESADSDGSTSSSAMHRHAPPERYTGLSDLEEHDSPASTAAAAARYTCWVRAVELLERRLDRAWGRAEAALARTPTERAESEASWVARRAPVPATAWDAAASGLERGQSVGWGGFDRLRQRVELLAAARRKSAPAE